MESLKGRDPQTMHLASSTIDYVLSNINSGLADIAYTFMPESQNSFITTARVAEKDSTTHIELPEVKSVADVTKYSKLWRIIKENHEIISFECRGNSYKRVSEVVLGVIKKWAEKSPDRYHNFYSEGVPYHMWKIFPSDDGFKTMDDLVKEMIKKAKK